MFTGCRQFFFAATCLTCVCIGCDCDTDDRARSGTSAPMNHKPEQLLAGDVLEGKAWIVAVKDEDTFQSEYKEYDIRCLLRNISSSAIVMIIGSVTLGRTPTRVN